MTKRVQRLTAQGLAARTGGPHDRRSVQIFLTPEGRALVERMLTQHLASTARSLGVLSPQELKSLHGLLLKSMDGLDARRSETSEG